MARKPKLKFVLHETKGAHPRPLDDVRFGELLGQLGDRDWPQAHRVEFNRTEEIELVVGVIVTAATLFGKAYVEALAKELAKWTVEELKRRRELKRARAKAGRVIVNLSRRGSKKEVAALAKLIRKAERARETIEIVFEA